MLVLLHLCLASAQQGADLGPDPRLDKHVSYRAVAASAKAAIAGLAQAAGLPLAAGGTIQSEILVLRLEDVPIRDAMVRLGHATAATWVVENGTYYLSRTDADVAKRQAVDTARLIAALKKGLAKQAKVATTQKPFDAASAKALIGKVHAAQNPKPTSGVDGTPAGFSGPDMSELQQQTPAGRLASRVFSQLDPTVLAQVPDRRRTVFSTNPTRMEIPLHLNLGDAIDVFVAEQSLCADELATFPEQDRFRLELFQNRLLGGVESKLPPAKLNVIVSRLDSFMSGFGLEVQLFDRAGAQLASSKLDVPTDPDMPPDRELMADPKEQKLTISPDDMTVMQVIGATLGGQRAKVSVLPESIRERMIHPDRNELLATFPSSLLLGAADTLHLNFVADLPDAYVVLGSTPGFTGLPTATSIIKLAKALPPSIGPVLVDDKWFEIAGGQAVPSALMAHRSSRGALAQLFDSSIDRVLTIEGLARYAYVGDGVPDDFMFLLLDPLLFPGSEINGSDQWRTYKLIGSLMHQQAEVPLKPGRIGLSSLDPGSIAILENIIFFQEPTAFVTKQSRGGTDSSGSEEPCDLLPDGLPRDGYIDVTITETETVFSTGRRQEAVEPRTLAFYQDMQEHPERYQGGSAGPESYTIGSKFRLGTVRKLQLHVQLSAGLSKDLSVKEQHLGSGNPVTFDELPKSFRDSYQQAKDSLKPSGG